MLFLLCFLLQRSQVFDSIWRDLMEGPGKCVTDLLSCTICTMSYDNTYSYYYFIFPMNEIVINFLGPHILPTSGSTVLYDTR